MTYQSGLSNIKGLENLIVIHATSSDADRTTNNTTDGSPNTITFLIGSKSVTYSRTEIMFFFEFKPVYLA